MTPTSAPLTNVDADDDFFVECPACDGDGVAWDAWPCVACGGSGYEIKSMSPRRTAVNVPRSHMDPGPGSPLTQREE